MAEKIGYGKTYDMLFGYMVMLSVQGRSTMRMALVETQCSPRIVFALLPHEQNMTPQESTIPRWSTFRSVSQCWFPSRSERSIHTQSILCLNFDIHNNGFPDFASHGRRHRCTYRVSAVFFPAAEIRLGECEFAWRSRWQKEGADDIQTSRVTERLTATASIRISSQKVCSQNMSKSSMCLNCMCSVLDPLEISIFHESWSSQAHEST